MDKRLAVFAVIVMSLGGPVVAQQYGLVRNGTLALGQKPYLTDAQVAAARKAGWKCPDAKDIPEQWAMNPGTPNGTLEYVPAGGRLNGGYIRLGGGGHLGSYFGAPQPGPYVMSVWARGKGEVGGLLYAYGKKGFIAGRTVIRAKVDSKVWVQYQGVWNHEPAGTTEVNTVLMGTGPVDIAELRFEPAEPPVAAVIQELASLYGTGILVEDREMVQVDDMVRGRAGALAKALADLEHARTDNPGRGDAKLADYLRERAKIVTAMVAGGSVVSANDYNEVVALTSLLAKLANKTIRLEKAVVTSPPPNTHRAGIRPARPNAVTITQVRPNKILYGQGENATVTVQIVNTTAQNQTGTLTCEQRWDLDGVAPLEKARITIAPGRTLAHAVSFNVGPEAFGREFHAEFLQDGRVVDAWSDFYSAADEWMRVHVVCGAIPGNKEHDTSYFGTYSNLRHYFGGMPSDFGYGAPKENRWLSGQCQYPMSRELMQNEIAYNHKVGVKSTFYVNALYCGQAGYEIVRRHPEWNVFDKNGQPQVDPVYGGCPNPNELALPIEVDENIVGKGKPKLTAWYHGTVNFSDLAPIRYGTEEIIKSIDMFNWDGVFWDGLWCLRAGLDYRGQSIIKKETQDTINVRNVAYITEKLRARNPRFATWYNWSHFMFTDPLYSCFAGEAQFDQAARVPNSCMLCEAVSQNNPKSPISNWKYHYKMVIDNRDFVVQKHGSIQDLGFLQWSLPYDQPGPSRWGWVFTNHLGAQFIATQMHPVVFGNPAWRPTMQFLTRYSGLLWARDIKTLPDADKIIRVSAPRKVWWKELVYTRKAADHTDYLVHLLNEPETPVGVYEYPTDPPAVTGARVSIDLPAGAKPVGAWALRAYDFGEPQTPKQATLAPAQSGSSVSVALPAFRYHCLVVLRIKS